MTNADKVRSMSNDELAEFMSGIASKSGRAAAEACGHMLRESSPSWAQGLRTMHAKHLQWLTEESDGS